MVLIDVKMRAGVRAWITFFIMVYLTPANHPLSETGSSVIERRLDTVEKNIKSINNAISRLVYAVSTFTQHKKKLK